MFREPKRQRNDPVFWMSRRVCEKKTQRSGNWTRRADGSPLRV